MIDFLAQASAQSFSTQEIVGVGAGGGVAIILAGVVKDLVRTAILERTKLGTKVRNGASTCKMTAEANDIMTRKDNDGNPLALFPRNEIRVQHKDMICAVDELSKSMIELATIVKSMRE